MIFKKKCIFIFLYGFKSWHGRLKVLRKVLKNAEMQHNDQTHVQFKLKYDVDIMFAFAKLTNTIAKWISVGCIGL